MDKILQPLLIFFFVKTVTLLHEKYGCRALTFFIWIFLLTEYTEAVCEARSPAGHYKTTAHQAGLE